MAGGRPGDDDQRSAAAAPLEWSDLLSPGSRLAPKLAYQLGESWPMVAGGVAGATLGVAAAGGPEDPFAAVTGLVGGALGAAGASGLQSFGNYFGEELRKSPDNPEGAYRRALERATVAGAFLRRRLGRSPHARLRGAAEGFDVPGLRRAAPA